MSGLRDPQTAVETYKRLKGSVWHADTHMEFRTVHGVARFHLMGIEPLTGVIAVSLVVMVVLAWCSHPPPDVYSGPGCNGP